VQVQAPAARGPHLDVARAVPALCDGGPDRARELGHARLRTPPGEQISSIGRITGIAQRGQSGGAFGGRVIGVNQFGRLAPVADHGCHGRAGPLIDHAKQRPPVALLEGARGRIEGTPDRPRVGLVTTDKGGPNCSGNETPTEATQHGIMGRAVHRSSQDDAGKYKVTVPPSSTPFELTQTRMRISAAGLTDVGLQRDHNEDTFSRLDKYRLYLVADGMGGHQSGEVASSMAAEAVRTFFEATEKEDATWPFPIDPNLSLAENRLAAAIKMANKQIFDRSLHDHLLQGMGTTVVGLLIVPDQRVAYVAHVGDSRAYRIRDGEILQLTRDHSLINDYLMMMPDMPKEAMDVLPKNVITRALGMQDSVVVDLVTEDIHEGDRFLLCSDGLSGQVTDERICEVVSEHQDDLETAVKILVQESNDAGGEDNVTLVIVGVDAD
jgi:PPM family protein phosphatase